MSSMLSRGAASAAALLLVACSPAPQPTTDHRGSPTATPAPTVSAVGSQTGTDAPRMVLRVERVPTDLIPGALVTDGVYVSWATGEAKGDTSPDIYRWKPAAKHVELVFRGPDRASGIQLLASHGDHYAFSAVGPEVHGFVTFTFWYVPKPGARPMKLASERRPVTRRGVLPQPTLSDDMLTYAIQRFEGARVISELVAMDLHTLKSTVLSSSNFADTEYWYPSLDGTRLVYGTVEYTNDRQHGERHAYLRDLQRPTDPPRRLDRDGEASMPVIRGATVAWKSAPRSFNMNNWGQVMRYSLGDSSLERLDFGTQAGDTEYVAPSIGNRFVVAEPENWSNLSVYDLGLRSGVSVERADPDGPAGFMRPGIAGDMLVWISAPDFTGIGGQIHYVQLPPAAASP